MFRHIERQHVGSFWGASLTSLMLINSALPASAETSTLATAARITIYVHATGEKTVQLGKIEVFCRATGSCDKPVLLPMHDVHASSHMYRTPIPLLSDEDHVIAPGRPGFGSITALPRNKYGYTFDNLCNAMDGDYRTNVALSPEWQAVFHEHQNPMLAGRGVNDHIFAQEGAEGVERDLPNARAVPGNSGHFALETHGTKIAEEMHAFLKATVQTN